MIDIPMGYHYQINGIISQTVVETPEFIKQAKQCLNDEARGQFIDFIAENPLSDEIMSGTGGARKIRWQRESNSGKRGGVRIIYYYHDEDMSIYLFTTYKKNQRENITNEEKNVLYKVIKLIVKTYNEGQS